MKYSSMKKNDLVLELEKRDNEIKRTREIMKMAAQEINGLELSNASARMFIGVLVKDIMDIQEVEEIYVDKQIASELLESHYVDFSAWGEENNGVVLKLVPHAKSDAENVDVKQEESEGRENEPSDI